MVYLLENSVENTRKFAGIQEVDDDQKNGL
jgi:hypothetical protein